MFSKEQLENFLNKYCQLQDESYGIFGGAHKFTSKKSYLVGKYQLILWQNENEFYLLGEEKGHKLEKIYHYCDDNVKIYEENLLNAIFFNAQLQDKLKVNENKTPLRKI